MDLLVFQVNIKHSMTTGLLMTGEIQATGACANATKDRIN